MDQTPPAAPDPMDDIDAAAGKPSLVTARLMGLAYKKGSGHIPELPMRDLTGPEVAARIPDRATLLSILATGYYTFIPAPKVPKASTPALVSGDAASGTTDSGDVTQEVEDTQHGG